MIQSPAAKRPTRKTQHQGRKSNKNTSHALMPCLSALPQRCYRFQLSKKSAELEPLHGYSPIKTLKLRNVSRTLDQPWTMTPHRSLLLRTSSKSKHIPIRHAWGDQDLVSWRDPLFPVLVPYCMLNDLRGPGTGGVSVAPHAREYMPSAHWPDRDDRASS